MKERPKNVILASTLAVLGALFTLVIIVLDFDLGSEGMVTKLGIYLLSMILFIAIGGSLSVNGQWSWRTLIFMEILCAAALVSGYLYEVVDLEFTAVLVLLSCLIIMFSASTSTRRWIDKDRI